MRALSFLSVGVVFGSVLLSLSIVSQAGTPASPDPSSSPTASGRYPRPATNIYIGSGYSDVKYLIPLDDSLGASWREAEFDDSKWSTGNNGLGFEQDGDLVQREVKTDIGEMMSDLSSTLYARYRFDLNNTSANLSDLKLRVKADDGFAAFLNGTMIASENTSEELVWNSSATVAKVDEKAIEWKEFELADHISSLREGSNVLAVQALNIAPDSPDFLITVELKVKETIFTNELYFRGDMPVQIPLADAQEELAILSNAGIPSVITTEGRRSQASQSLQMGTSFINFESPHVHPIDLSPSGDVLAAVNTADHKVELIDVTKSPPTLIASVPVGMDPVSVRFQTENELWVVNHISDSISIVDVGQKILTRTIQTGDEPADVVFAGDPRRAYVTCSQENTVEVFDLENLSAASNKIVIEGEDPRALTVSPDGSTVYAAVFESGNGSTILAGGIENNAMMNYPPNVVSSPNSPYKGLNPPPLRNDTSVLPREQTTKSAPKVSLIVRKDDSGVWRDDNGADWSEFVSGESAPLSGRPVGWDVVDNDIAMIDTQSGNVSYATTLMTIGMAMDVNPATGDVMMVGTDAMNEVRSEPALKGKFSKVIGASVNANGQKTVFDLNPHLDYIVATLPPEERTQSIGDPRAIQFNENGTLAYVAGMGSNNIAVITPSGLRLATIRVGEGPTGLALDSENGRMFVLNRFDASVSVVDLERATETSRVDFFDPTPLSVKRGRRVFYNTHETSGLGQVSCASCHLDGKIDRLAWDLGNPEGTKSSGLRNVLFESNGDSPEIDMHPMKGPMVTQTLQDIDDKGPFHWRGDRQTLEDFNPTFVDLLGNDRQMSDEEMEDFTAFLKSMHFPPNPYRLPSNSLSRDMPLPGRYTTGKFGEAGKPLPNGDADRGFKSIFSRRKHPMLGNVTCIECHSQTSGLGQPSLSTNQHGITDRTAATQGMFKVVQLRNLYDKVGFSTASGRSLSGFGFFHDGSVDTLERFVSQDMFALRNDQEVANLVAFLLSFSGNESSVSERAGWSSSRNPTTTAVSRESHASVGKQATVFANEPRTDRLQRIGEITRSGRRGEVEIVAYLQGQQELPDRLIMNALSGGNFRGETGKERYSITELASAGGTIQLTVVPPGQATRLAFDRDGDLLRDSVEGIDYLPGIPGVNTPFDPLDPDASGDQYAIGPDGVPDWKNDFDGDGESNLSEVDRGTNPADGWVPTEKFTVTATLSPDGTGIILQWPGQRGRAYQVQGSGDLTNWTDIPGLNSPSNSGQVLKMTAPREGPYCYYRIRTD